MDSDITFSIAALPNDGHRACMFHDEGIPDAPCNCSDGLTRYGQHDVIIGEVVSVGSDPREP